MLQIDALSEVVSATASSGMEIYLDGGISLGTDVFKAIALGAKMVLQTKTKIFVDSLQVYIFNFET